MEKVQNLLNFSDFEKSWNPKKQKSTKKTEVGLDVLERRLLENDENELIDDIDEEDVDIDINDDEDIDIDEVDDECEDWEECLTSEVDKFVNSGVDASEILDFLVNYITDTYDIEDFEYERGEIENDIDDEDIDEEEDIDLDDEDLDIDEEDIDLDDEDIDDEDLDIDEEDEIVADDEEGVQESFRFNRRR